MNLLERLHYLHRAYRYRYRSERHELSCLMRQDLRGATVVDAGANRGAWSWWMHKKVGPRGNVVAFEPQPELGEYLAQVKSAFGLQRLHVVNKALSSKSGREQMVRPQAHWVGGSLELSADYPDSDCFQVELTTLDEYFAGQPTLRPIRFLKCDIQDHEYACFLGGRHVLSEDLPAIMFECTDPAREESRAFPLLESLGYDGYYLHNGGIHSIDELVRRCNELQLGYFNCYFLPRPAEARATRNQAA